MGTERDFVVKKGLKVAEDIELGHASDTTIARASAGQITVEGTAVVLAGSANHDGFSDFVANEHIDHSGVSISAGSGLTGGGTIAANRTLTVGAGNGITVNTNDVAVTAAQTTITSVLNASLVAGRDAHNQIKFSTDDQIIFRVGNADGVTFKASGEIEATKFDGALEGNADTASVASRVVVVANNAAGSFVNENNLILFSPDGASSNDGGNLTPESSTAFHYNPSTTILTVPKIAGDVTGSLTGTATNATAITLGGHLINDVDIGTELVDTDDHIMSSGAIKAYVDANAGGGTTGYTYTDTAGSEQFKITDTSDTALVLIEQLGTGNAFEIHDVASDTSIFKVMANGNIGMGLPSGTSFGGAKLYVSGSIHATSNFKAEQSMGVSTPGFNFNGDNNTGMGQFQGADSLGFVTGGTERLTIGSAGQLGIAGANYGTDGQVLTSTGANSAPAWENAASGGASTIGALTDVKVDETNFVNSFLIQTDSDGSAPTFTGTLNSATGNIGIGKTVLTALESGDENIGFGTWALKSLNSGGSNTAVGSYAGRDVSSGTNNVMLGASAGYGITTGTYNIALGTNTLSGAVTGSNNIAIGLTSQNDTTSGAHNISLGTESMSLNTNGSYHIGIGFRALKSIGQSGGSGAIAIGKNAYQNATSGGQQIAIGEDAMGAGGTSGGSQNIAIGWEAGKAIDNADYNTFIGTKSGKSNTTGSRNIAIGVNSYDAATTENDNIAIGYNALGGDVAGGEKNVVVGNYAGDAVTSADGSVIIGHNAGTAVQGGNYNTLLGFEAGAQMTSGYANVAIGRQANRYGNGNDSIAIGFGALSNADLAGDRNIGIGYSAGNSITTGDGNVVIGNANVSSATGDNQLSISSNSASSPVTWITGDSNGNVKGTDFYMVAEWNDQYFSDSLRNGKRFSFGAGMNNNTNSDSGTIGTETILPKACTLEEMHFWIGNVGAETGSGNFTVRIDKNGTELTTGYTFNMSGSGGNHVQKSFTPNVSFDAGETFNLTLHDAATSGYGSQNQIGRVRVTFRFRTNN